MVPEKAFTDKEKFLLNGMRLRSEMAVASEWIVRDEAKPDFLLTVFVAPTDHGDDLQVACSCLDGVMDRPCPHALDVLQKIRAQDHILIEIFKRRPRSTAA